jgi:hypothetical protein
MNRARLRALGLLTIVAIAAAAIALFARQRPLTPAPERAAAERPVLKLLTGLPLMFGDEFSLHGNGSPALAKLQAHYRVEPVSTGAASELKGARLLLMAQPAAQRPEDLVAIDHWVRAGGRVLLLADPALQWPSGRPLGDPLRPPPTFADTGLLSHWGLGLDAPDTLGPRQLKIGQFEIMAGSPGTLAATARSCEVEPSGLVARCRIGRGRATVVADADFLDVGRPEGLDGPTQNNLAALIGELALLEGPDSR